MFTFDVVVTLLYMTGKMIEPLPKKWTLESQRNSTRPHIVDSKINRRPCLVDSNKYP